MKEYCHECDDFVEVTYRTEKLKSEIGDYVVKYIGDVVYCNKCGTEVYVKEVSDTNIKIVHSKYQELVRRNKSEKTNLF